VEDLGLSQESEQGTKLRTVDGVARRILYVVRKAPAEESEPNGDALNTMAVMVMARKAMCTTAAVWICFRRLFSGKDVSSIFP
jgi:hypothetical protein